MGAWGTGSFDNDEAMDFAATICAPKDLLGPLRVESPDQGIDASLACQIIVVAECVAAMRGFPSVDTPDDLAKRIAAFGQPGRSLYLHARDRLDAVLQGSELMDLWADDDPDPFVEAVHELIGRLNHRVGDPAPSAKGKNKPFYEQDWFKAAPCGFCNQPLEEQEFASVSTKINDGLGSEIGFDAWAHLACLNRALHYRYRMRPFSMYPEDIGEGDTMFDVLDAPPTLED
ncbi:MAG: DUF4259 domain-containing protein [Pseudomonadota bacterium]